MTPTTSSALSQTLTGLGERYFDVQHRYDPYNATLLGISDVDHLAGDPRLAASEQAAADLDAIGREVARLDLSGATEAELVDHGVMTSLVRGAGDDARHALWATNASPNGYVSRQGLVFQAVPAMTTGDDESRGRYLERLSGLGGYFTALGERYAMEASRGRVPTRLGVLRSVQQLEGYLALAVADDVLLGPARASGDAETLSRATALVEREVRPAMADLAARLTAELLPVGRVGDRVGIHAVPGGAEGYQAAVRRHTTTDLTADEIHRIGLDELEQMRAEWSAIGRRALGEEDVSRIAARMRGDRSLRFETTDEIVAVARGALARAEAVRGDWFPATAIPECVIEQINPIDAGNSALGYYRPPAVDGSRPGAYCVLAADPTSHYRYEYEALSFHESVPGHHLQLATAQLLDIPRYRRHLDVEACSFNEGWGLYSEQLADEMGLYSDDLSRLGMLSFRALRACRLVVDTGLHHLGWTRDKAIDFMFDHTATTREHVTSEVDRYIAWPGQALAYLIGRREIVRLRAGAEQQLGTRFSVIDFHAALLGHGAVPLTVLAEIVERWTASTVAPRRNS